MWVAAVIVGLACLGLGYRLVVLEGEVESLELALGRFEAAPTAAPGRAQARDAGVEDREVVALTAELARLRREVSSMERATADKATLDDIDTAIDEQRILDVVKRKQAAVRGKQLAFQRDRWVGWRKDALDRFAAQAQLEPEQQAALMEHLEQEADGIVTLMQRPGAEEDPWKAADEWRALLDETDRKVQEVLDERQLPAWTHARTVERRVLWPWLTEKK